MYIRAGKYMGSPEILVKDSKSVVKVALFKKKVSDKAERFCIQHRIAFVILE